MLNSILQLYLRHDHRGWGLKKIQKFIKSKRCDAARMDFPKKAELVYSGLRSKANILNEQFCSVVTQEDTTRVVAFQQ